MLKTNRITPPDISFLFFLISSFLSYGISMNFLKCTWRGNRKCFLYADECLCCSASQLLSNTSTHLLRLIYRQDLMNSCVCVWERGWEGGREWWVMRGNNRKKQQSKHTHTRWGFCTLINLLLELMTFKSQSTTAQISSMMLL